MAGSSTNSSTVTGFSANNLRLIIVICLIIIMASNPVVHSLSFDHYRHTCPNFEQVVATTVNKGMLNDRRVPAALLRMHFHDCFIRGCDGSVLLESKGKKKAEKDGPPNISLHAFYVIDHAKEAVEALCPGVVSCADILAIAARDAVALSGGPNWEVLKGRLDGRISRAKETRQLPPPVFNITQLQQSWAQRGLSSHDLVALSGGHTLGFAHCSSFENRIHKFNSSLDVDPRLQSSFAATLKTICPLQKTMKNAGSAMDTTTFTFDNIYFKLLLQGKGLFNSDHALLDTPQTRALVSNFAASQDAFFNAFVNSMRKMSSISGNGNQIRLNCRRVLN